MIEIIESKEEHIEKLKNLQPAISKQKEKLISLINNLRVIK